jgi:hypothetical protein
MESRDVAGEMRLSKRRAKKLAEAILSHTEEP